MTLFPFMMDIENKTCLIVGGGIVAYRKVKVLLPFGVRIHLMGREICSELWALSREEQNLVIEEKEFEEKALSGMFFVIAATNDEALNHYIAEKCRENGILCNAVDQIEDCDFSFPAIIKEKDLLICVSTNGKFPAGAAYFKKQLKNSLSPYAGDVIENAAVLRGKIIRECKNPVERSAVMQDLLDCGLASEGVLTAKDVEACMKRNTAIKIGTRDSALALVQADMLKKSIEKSTDRQALLVGMKTTGDRILHKSLEEVGGKGLFMKELDIALAEGKTDLSIHSLKDVTMEVPDEYPILAVSRREDPRDVLVLPKGAEKLDLAKPIGCSSKRRRLQIQKLFPEAKICTIRGNVKTRLEKLDNGEFGALILAAAGLIRLGEEKRISRYFSIDEMLPAAGQGILAVQGRADFEKSLLDSFADETAYTEMLAERAFVRCLDGGCKSPVAAYAKAEKGKLRLRGLYYEDSLGEDYYIEEVEGDLENPEKLGYTLACSMREKYGTRKHE